MKGRETATTVAAPGTVLYLYMGGKRVVSVARTWPDIARLIKGRGV